MNEHNYGDVRWVGCPSPDGYEEHSDGGYVTPRSDTANSTSSHHDSDEGSETS
jgi:hypothetical protein